MRNTPQTTSDDRTLIPGQSKQPSPVEMWEMIKQMSVMMREMERTIDFIQSNLREGQNMQRNVSPRSQGNPIYPSSFQALTVSSTSFPPSPPLTGGSLTNAIQNQINQRSATPPQTVDLKAIQKRWKSISMALRHLHFL